MNDTVLMIAAIFVPTAGAFALPAIGKISERLRNAAAFAMVAASCACSAALIPSALAGRAAAVSIAFPLGFNLSLSADALAVFMACVSSFIGLIIVLYSFDYISHYGNRNEYYMDVALFLGSMMGIVYSANLVFLYIFWELTAIASWRLIGFFRAGEHVIKADKAFLVTVFGALVMLVGFILIYALTGSFDLAAIKASLGGKALPGIVVLLVMFGILSKSATLPFHTWLPDAGVAPSPVTALLHAAVLVKIGVYVYARLFIATFTISALWHTVIPAVAAASALVSAGAALVETDMKRIIAYSTVSQIAFIFLGLAVGGSVGVAGALLYILMHGLAKGGLFLCAGIVEQNTHTRDISKMGGLAATMPLTALAFFACSLSVMGVPPFGGFFSKFMVFSGAIYSGRLWISAAFLLGAFMTIMYLFRIFNMIFMGEAAGAPAREGSRVMVFSVLLLAAASLLGGIYIRYPSLFTDFIARHMAGI
jgi:NADH:ubiquinone oxidoreductase subunit 5 (subunit L)/multisubunit Na+/H+ antiporter MnhA subunit